MPESRNMNMIIASLRKHWPARKMEWAMAGILAAWGVYLLLHPDIFTHQTTGAALLGMADMVPFGLDPAFAWGSWALLVASARAAALYINGAHTRTPVVRVITALLTMFVFTQVCYGLAVIGVANMNIPVYAGLVVADMFSAYQAAHDAIEAEVQRRTERGRDRRSSTSLG